MRQSRGKTARRHASFTATPTAVVQLRIFTHVALYAGGVTAAVSQPGGSPPARDRPEQDRTTLGLPQATSLVLGTIIGVGVSTCQDPWRPSARSA